MSDITDDEFTVLMIAAQGESMMPIGKWEKPVESLVVKGYLKAENKFNNYITDAGRKAVAARDKQDDEVYRQILITGGSVNNVRVTAARMINDAVALLAQAARLYSLATGMSEQFSLEELGRELIRAAKEQLK